MAVGTGWNLGAELRGLEKETNAHRRGLLFEGVIADLFRTLRFEVSSNAGAARPRQTDLLAVRGNDRYLVECKWRATAADIDDIDSLRARLRRAFGATGLMISMAGFSEPAISDVSAHRDQPILLISGDELRSLGRLRDNELLDLLWHKRETLFTDGRAVVDEPARRRRTGKRRPLPDSPIRFVLSGDEPTPVLEVGGHFGQFTFAHEMQDIDWTPASGTGVTLDVSLPLLTQDGILDLTSKLADLGWASSDACWSIQQAHAVWTGFGAAAFANTLPHWRQRAASDEAHHSEEFCYVDRCAGGFYSLTATIPAHKGRWAHNVVLSFQFQGVPLDTSPLLQLCRMIGMHDEVYFRPRSEKSVTRVEVPDWMRPIGDSFALLTVSDPLLHREFVRGLVVPNPLRDPRWRDDPRRYELGLGGLEDLECLICFLGEFHLAGDDRTYKYTLQHIEVARTSEGVCLRPFARWDYANEAASHRYKETGLRLPPG